MIDNYEIITYMTIFLILVYIGKSVNYTKNGIIATIIAAIVVFSLIYFKTPNKKIRNEKYPIIEKNLKLKHYPFLSIEPKFIKIFNYLLGYNKENHTTILRIVKLTNSFFKKYYTIYNHYSKRDYRKIENAIEVVEEDKELPLIENKESTKEKLNKQKSDSKKLLARAKKVGLKPLGKGRHTKTKRKEWLLELEKLEADNS